MSRSPSPANEELHVVQSPSVIPFPAPATPLRSQRSAARAATSSMKVKQEATTDEEGMTTASEPDLTNDDTADSWSAGEGETDEAIMMEEDDDASVGIPTEDESPPPQPRSARKRKTPAKKKATAAAMAKASDGEEGVEEAASSPAKKKRKTAAAATKKSNGKAAKKAAAANGVTSKDFGEGEQEEIDTGILSDSSGLTPAEELSENQEEQPKPKRKRKAGPAKPRKPRAPKPEPVYVIPDVEKKPNPGYQGRLGYACLNTILRKKKPLPIFCSRTCRIDTIKKNGMDFLKELGRTNIKDLIQLIEWNEANNIRFMRLSSEMFPFASHGEYGYTLEYADKELKEAGDLVKKYGHRVTTHPGQFTQLGSPRPIVVENAVKDLVYHCEMLDRMGMGPDSVMIIHGGGTFQDKPATLERIKKNYKERLPDNVKGRVVLENDEMCYNVDDLLPLCEELNIPMVLDYHHDWIFPRAEQTLEELMPRILATWERKGIKPKFHLSEPRPGAVTVMERRAHSDRCKTLPTPLPSHVDLMIEAKDKEQAVLELHRIYDLQPVIHESLRPPAEVETLHTQGRKSSKKKKAKAVAEGDEGEEGVEDAVDPDEAMLDVDGAEVAPPVEGTNAKKAKTPAKRGRAKKDTNAAVKAEDGEEGEQPKSAAKKAATPRKSRAKKAAAPASTPAAQTEEAAALAKTEEEEKKLEEQVRAEPPEAEPIEDMKMKEVPEPIVDSVPCETPLDSQESRAA